MTISKDDFKKRVKELKDHIPFHEKTCLKRFCSLVDNCIDYGDTGKRAWVWVDVPGDVPALHVINYDKEYLYIDLKHIEAYEFAECIVSDYELAAICVNKDDLKTFLTMIKDFKNNMYLLATIHKKAKVITSLNVGIYDHPIKAELQFI